MLQSESFRHAALYAGLFAVSMIVLIAVIYTTMDNSFRGSLLRASNDDLQSIQKAYAAGLPRGKGVHEAKEMIEDRMLAPDETDRFLLQSASGKRLAGNMPPMAPHAGTFDLHYPEQDGKVHDVLGSGAFLSRDVYAYVGRDRQEAQQTELSVLKDFAGIFLGSIFLAALSGLFLGRNFLARIDRISATCHSIMAGRLGERIPAGDSQTELGRLATTINGMLDRIQTLMQSLEQVTNDIAHDMRTPLTHLRHSLERAHKAGATREQYAAAVENALHETDQLLEMFAALLRIAEIEAGARRDGFVAVDLGKLLDRAFEMYRPVMHDEHRPFRVDAASGLAVRGDPRLLLQMISNLLDNASIHTPRGAAVTLRAHLAEGRPTLVVTDAGPGISPEDREKVFRRFYRREQSRTSPGSGLGLSLVAVIAALHEATVRLEDGNPGLRVVIRFPEDKALAMSSMPDRMTAELALQC